MGHLSRASSHQRYKYTSQTRPRRTDCSVQQSLRLELGPLPLLSPLKPVRCRNTLEITPIVVIKRSKAEATPVSAAEARSTLLQTKLISPGQIAPCSTRRSWRPALGRLHLVSRMARRLTSSCTLRKSLILVAKGVLSFFMYAPPVLVL